MRHVLLQMLKMLECTFNIIQKHTMYNISGKKKKKSYINETSINMLNNHALMKCQDTQSAFGST